MGFIVGAPTQGMAQEYSFLIAAATTSVSGFSRESLYLNYTPGFEQVYVNGSKMTRGQDYQTDLTGTTISGFSPALDVGDEVVVVAINVFSLADMLTRSGNLGDLVDKAAARANLGFLTSPLPRIVLPADVAAIEIAFPAGFKSLRIAGRAFCSADFSLRCRYSTTGAGGYVTGNIYTSGGVWNNLTGAGGMAASVSSSWNFGGGHTGGLMHPMFFDAEIWGGGGTVPQPGSAAPWFKGQVSYYQGGVGAICYMSGGYGASVAVGQAVTHVQLFPSSGVFKAGSDFTVEGF
jgi:hypothetical protein